ncbi:hypothetical protein BH09MYX1_BH09MYX1_10110 [soil metagenome]
MIFDVVAIDHLDLLARFVVGFAALVVVPLVLRSAFTEADRPLPRAFQWIAAASFALALVVRTPIGGALVLPWGIAVTMMAGRAIAVQLRKVRSLSLPDVALTAAFVYLPVGAIWAGAYRLGVPIGRFAGLECLLTSAHFHYAGFGACALVALLGRELGKDAGYTYRIGAVGTIVSIALVAAGITASHAVERLSAWTLLASVLLVDVNLVRLGLRSRGGARVLLLVAPLASVVAAGFAAHFAESGFATLDDYKLRRMLYLHGIVNAFGFVTLGLLGIWLRRRSEERQLAAGRTSVDG